MSKSGPFMAIVVTALMLTMLLPLEFNGAGANYGKNVSASLMDVTFTGSAAAELVGGTMVASSKGDVNGDGLDDLLFSGYGRSNGTTNGAGAVYLVFGKKTGWAKTTSVLNADVTFFGEAASNYIGAFFSIAGDINGDGYDDILITSFNANASAGRTYLIFGKASGWVPKFFIANATASFDGAAAGDRLGESVGGVGDVNGDGFDDFYLSSIYIDQPGTDNGRVYLFLGKATGWSKHMSPSSCDASFYGSDNSLFGGFQIGAGDINGDGFDDLTLGNFNYNATVGKVYIFFGKKSGWTKDVNVETRSDASIIGNSVNKGVFGYRVSPASDVNGDGIKDLFVAAPWEPQPGLPGKAYLIFGKVAGWIKNASIAAANASFVGEVNGDLTGQMINAGGDLNGDGFEDLVLSTLDNDQAGNGAGKAYVILGKSSGWAMDMPLANADASFLGKATFDSLGRSLVILGDINGDGIDDLSVGAAGSDPGGMNNAGEQYVAFFETNKQPTPITSVKAYTSKLYMNETAFALPGDGIFVELRGTDSNASRRDIAVVKLTSTANPVGFNLRLFETGVNTGVYQESFRLWDRTWEEGRFLEANLGDTVTITSATDLTKKAVLTVGAIGLMPLVDTTAATEDAPYAAAYWGVNVTAPVLQVNFSAPWLTWNATSFKLTGTPDNSNVGDWNVSIRIADAFGRYDERTFTITVANTPPVIETADVDSVTEDEVYEVDYNSSDDGQGVITWHLETNASFLELNSTTGVLNGTPLNSDVGNYLVNVSVDDGNGGTDHTNFTLMVGNINDRPSITTTDMVAATEDQLYQVDYQATDVDALEKLTWSLETDAKFLALNPTTGRLNGTPSNADVGTYYVNVTVTDHGGLNDFHNFTLTVANVNQAPVWKDVPSAEVKINSLQTYTFDVNATDVDVGDKLYYSAAVIPSVSALSINFSTGILTIGPLDAGVYTVNLSCTDSIVKVHHVFTLNVTHKNSPPTALLIGPTAGETVTTAKPVLQWATADFDTDPVTVDVYFSSTESSVTGKAATAKIVTRSSVKTYTYTTYLVPGTKYYWTVVPSDATEMGTCLNGTFNFTVSSTAKVNHPPVISPPAKVPDATATKDYKLTVTGADPDGGTTLTYSLQNQPAGMSISPAGEITWKPTKEQAKTGTFTFNVIVSDSEFTASTPITVKVKKAPETGLGAMMIPILLILIIIIVIIVILALSMRKAPKDEDDEGDEDELGEEE